MTAAAPRELESLLVLARTVALEAAALIAERRRAGFTVSTKGLPTDMVTEVDRASEELIVARLRAARPGDGIIGEEGANDRGTSGVCWHVDPIDGTTNFIYGFPAYSVSICAEVEGERMVGVVHNVAIGETFAAATGLGATLDGRPIRVSEQADLSAALIGTGFGYNPLHRAAQAAVLAKILGQVRDVRRAGSAALDLCSVACGRYDAYYEQPLSTWDFGAGDVIVREAGGMTGSVGGGPIANGSIVAAGPFLFEPFRALLQDAGAHLAWPDGWPAPR